MLTRFLDAFAAPSFALLRVVTSLLFAFHGLQKFGVLSDYKAPFGSQAWIGAVIELVTGAAMALGIQTRWAAFLASGTMAVAYIQFHWKLQLGAQLIPTINQGELAVVYAFLFLFIACCPNGPARAPRT